MTVSTDTTDSPVNEISEAVVRFAGDSGDGMQLAGTQFTDTSALIGNDVATLPDYPAEIRAPAGTVAGVSGFQINFADQDIYTPGDHVNALIAMNPAAFKAHIKDVQKGGIVIANDSEFTKTNLKKAGYEPDYNPLDDEQYSTDYQLIKVPISRLNKEALEDTGMGTKEKNRCRNMFALGIVYWLYDRPFDQTVKFLNGYFRDKKNKPEVADANIKALKQGYYFGETAEIFPIRYQISKAHITPGKYRKVTGGDALSMGLIAAASQSKKDLVYCSYPITPASPILHSLSAHRQFGVKTFQAEDEIAAVCAAIGVSFAGQLGVCGTSGPGVALKSEAIGLAVMTELPLLVVNVQRGGPSTGLPTKTEQSDLLQSLFGRNGDSPVVVIAAKSPTDCFDAALEAAKISLEHMVPVILLADGYLANGSEPWLIPDVESLPKIKVNHAANPQGFEPYNRDENLVRPWALPGTPDMQHRLGGLEKEHITGNVAYEPDNHQFMTGIRQKKIDKIAEFLAPIEVEGEDSGELLVVGWGGTYGSIATATKKAQQQGKSVSSIHLRHINPMPKNLGDVLSRFEKILVPELNTGQLRLLLRGKYLVDARGVNKVQGRPFLVEELTETIDLMLENKFGDKEFVIPRQHHVDIENQEFEFASA